MSGIVMRGVSKRFAATDAVVSVDLDVPAGHVLALLGSNGAGKTTLIRMGATTVTPDSGSITIGGVDAIESPSRARRHTGVVSSEERSFYWRLSGRQNLEFFASLHALGRKEAQARAVEALEIVGFTGDPDLRVDKYSSGMKARLALARGLLGRPSILLLDEPSRSLDPAAAFELRTLIAELASAQGVAVLFVTHDLHEAAALANAVVVMKKGKVVARVDGPTDAATLERHFVSADL